MRKRLQNVFFNEHKTYIMKRLIQLLFVAGLLFTLQSCQKEGSTDNQDNLKAPTVPNAALLTIPTQSFGLVDHKESSSTRNGKANWIHAGINVLVWNTIIYTHTATPITAFRHSFNSEAVYLGDLTWEWKYAYQAPTENGGQNYDISLTGQYIENQAEVSWTMTVSVSGSANEFVWFEGVVSTDNSSGIFKINTISADHQPYLELAFDKNLDSNDAKIRFSNILENDGGNGDYIEWRTANGDEYDRAYDIFIKNNLLEIQANEADDFGRVKDQKHFDDSEWHCWDSNKISIDC